MSSERIQTGATEPIEVLVVDAAGALLTGLLNVKVQIRRQSDDFYLDWSDNSFRAGASVVTMLQALGELDLTYAPGIYRFVGGWNTSTIANPVAGDTYFVTAVQDGVPQNAGNLPARGEIKSGQWPDDLKRLLGLSQENTFFDNTVFDVVGQVTSARIRIFDSKANCDLATDGGGETAGLIASYTITGLWGARGRMATYKQTRD